MEGVILGFVGELPVAIQTVLMFPVAIRRETGEFPWKQGGVVG
jgi:hypothetical protein